MPECGMKRLFFTLAMCVLPVISFAQESEDVRQYDIDKWVKSKAENSCLALANVVLPPDAYEAIILRTEAKTFAVVTHDYEGYTILVAYPYRQDGGTFHCSFRDYRRNKTIQLFQFGYMNKSTGEDTFTEVKPLW
jgi:hypothetical protein